jgi:alpha/beta superfamily hydrolase
MLRFLHFLLVGAYLTLPPLAVARVALGRKRRRAGDPDAPQPGSLIVTFVCGCAIAAPVCLVYGYALRGHVPATQFLIAAYFATSMLLLLKCLDAGLLFSLRRMARLHRPAGGTISRGMRTIAVLVVRAVILAAIALPFVMAAAMVYRPKVVWRDDPLSQLGFPFERVEFRTADGVKLVGWWIPAMQTPRSRDWEMAGRETAIICHGLAAGKSNQLTLARRLVPAGFNVLIFDFRAHGESGGQVTGYGGLEKQDVLAAVQWVRQTHPKESEKIVGVGASLGAVALLSAATDNSDEGRAISAVAAYGAYDDFHELLSDATQILFRPPMPSLIEYVGLPIASLHAGVDLKHIAPKETIAQLWPRPVLFIHGERDEIIPIERGQALHESATQPKYYVWFPRGSHNEILSDETAAWIVLEFFKTAAPVPVI